MVAVGFFSTLLVMLYCALVRFFGAYGAGPALRSRTLLPFWPVPLLTRRVYRWSEVREVFDWLAFKTVRSAMMENRSAVYYLFGVVPVCYRLYRVEVRSNLKAASFVNNGSHIMDPYFPPHLAYQVPA